MASFENRKFIRADIALKVAYKSLTAPVHEGVAFSRDISVLGMNLIMPDILIKETPLELKIYLDEEIPPISAKGKLVWQKKCNYLPESNRQYYISGIQFTDMPVEDALRASEFVRGYLRHQSETDIKQIIELNEKLKTP